MTFLDQMVLHLAVSPTLKHPFAIIAIVITVEKAYLS